MGAQHRGRTPDGSPTIKERWDAARAAGEQTFDPGVACIHGHTCRRWTNNGICIECKRARDIAYNAKHCEEHRRRSRESQRRRRKEVNEYHAEWRRKNPDKWMAIVARREAKKRGQTPPSDAFWAKAMSANPIPCYWCGKKTKPGKKTRHIDHIIPLAEGGSDTDANLCISCAKCNLEKHAKMPAEFAGQAEIRFAA